MVSKFKKMIWKIQDSWRSLSRRAEIDMFFHIGCFILELIILYLLIKMQGK